MSLFRAQNQALAMKWGPTSIDLNGKPIIRKIAVTTSCHHFVLRTATEVNRIFVQIFMAGYGPLQAILRADKPSAELFLLHVDPISPLKPGPWTIQNPTIHAGVDWSQITVCAIWTQAQGKTLALHNVLTDYAVPWTLDGLYSSNMSRKQQGVRPVASASENCC